MRVVSVVSLISPDGAYGGPTRVALNQARALMDRGHEVVVAAGTRGYDQPPDRINGVPVKLFPVTTAVPRVGFAGLASAAMVRWLTQSVRAADIVHVHLARDLLTMPAAVLATTFRVPYVLQPHGMIDPSRRRSAQLLDAAATRRVLRGASSVLHLTPEESADLQAVSRCPLPLAQVVNGVPESPATWAPTQPPEVLFLARLHAIKRPSLFVEMAHEVKREYPDVRFTLVGPDEGEGEATQKLIRRTGAARWEGSIAPDESLVRMSRASIYVLPSSAEVFPMAVVEAMSLGMPVVINDGCGLAGLVREHSCGLVVDRSLDALVNAVRSLLRDPESARRMGENGRRATRDVLGIGAVAQTLERLYACA